MSLVLTSILRCLQGNPSDIEAVILFLNRSEKSVLEEFWRVASSHGVEFMVLQALEKSVSLIKFDITPQKTLARENLLNNLELVSTLLKLARESHRRRLRVFCFKGPVIAAMAYGNLSLRGAGDLDFLIEKEDLELAIELLREQAFESVNQLRGRRYQEFHFHLPFERDDGLEVEVHWAISREYMRVPFDFSKLWERQTAFELQSETIAALSPEDHFLILCVHGTRHLWERLTWVCDLRALLTQFPEFDWAYVEREARELGCLRMVLLGHLLVERLFHEVFAASLLVEAYRQPAVLEGARAILLRYDEKQDETLGAFQRDWACFLLRERYRDKLRFFWCFPWREYIDLWEEQIYEGAVETSIKLGFSGVFKRLFVGLRRQMSKK